MDHKDKAKWGVILNSAVSLAREYNTDAHDCVATLIPSTSEWLIGV